MGKEQLVCSSNHGSSIHVLAGDENAAALLGISRATLYRRIEAYGLDVRPR